MARYGPFSRNDNIGGGASPKRVFVPNWTYSANNQAYSTPDTLPTSEPTDANYTWTIDSGDFPQVESDSGAWVLNGQTAGFARVLPFMVWFFQNVGTAWGLNFKFYHKHSGGTIDLYGDTVTSSAVSQNYYCCMSTSIGTTTTIGGYNTVVDDVVGAKIWNVTGADYRLHHRSMILVLAWYRPWNGCRLRDFSYLPEYPGSNATGWKTLIGIDSAWSASTITAHNANLQFQLETSNFSVSPSAGTTYYGDEVAPYTFSVATIGDYGFLVGGLESNTVGVSNSANQSSVYHRPPTCMKSISGAPVMRDRFRYANG